MSKLSVILIASALIVSSGMAMAQSTDDSAAPAMTMKKKPPVATKDNTDANPAASSEKPAQPGGPSGTGAAAKTNGDTSK